MHLENAPTYEDAISKLDNNMHVPKTEVKQVILKSYSQIAALEKAVKAIQENETAKKMVSIIGNYGDDHTNDLKGLAAKKKYLRSFFKERVGIDTEFDFFYNPAIGYLFVAGFLVATFLNPVGERTLGALSGGPYGVLRGLGVSEGKATLSVKKLYAGSYLLVVRGDRYDMENLEDILEKI